MPKRIYKCVSCKRYTLNKSRCPVCGGEVKSAHPPRWSPVDKYSQYRVRARIELKLQKNQLEKPPEDTKSEST